MKRCKIIIIVLILISLENVYARSGCCSWHKGVAGCSSSGRVICNDGTYSPSCTCTPQTVYGCTDWNAINYNNNANQDDGGCKYKKQISETIELDYEVEIHNPSNIENGKESIIQTGQKGQKVITYEIITDKNGTELSKEQVSETVITQPVNEIVVVEEIKVEVESDNKESTIDISSNQEEKEDSEDNSVFIMIMFIIFIFNMVKVKSETKKFPILYLITKIHHRIPRYISYCFYFLFLFPVIIDFIIYIVSKIKKI